MHACEAKKRLMKNLSFVRKRGRAVNNAVLIRNFDEQSLFVLFKMII